jgi:hypothetical protein
MNILAWVKSLFGSNETEISRKEFNDRTIHLTPFHLSGDEINRSNRDDFYYDFSKIGMQKRRR